MDESVGSEGTLGFERFFAETSRHLVGQAYALTGNLQEAQDLAQEALAQAWRHWAEVSEYADPAAWTRRVLHHLAVSRWRRLRLQRKHESWTTVRHAPAPEAAHLDVVAAVRRLPAGQRRTLVLHDVVGLTGEEIAAELGVPAGTVRAWLHRGRQSVAKELGWSDPKAASAVGEAQSPKEETRDD